MADFATAWTPPGVADELAAIKADGRLRGRRDVTLLPGGRCLRDGREMLHFASNDYLGLSTNPQVIAAAIDAASAAGIGARSGALVARHDQQRLLEETLAEFEGAEAALVFPSGYAANIGVISALASSEDTIFCDKENHACLIDGCRLSGAALKVYRRTDLSKLDDRLAKVLGGQKLIATDGVFSMDGMLAPLPELQEIAIRRGATLIVDEAHGTGVYGPNARGAIDHFGLDGAHIVRTGTLSKGIGCQGGFVTGSQTLIDYIWNTARTQMFSTGLAIPVCAAATKAVRLVASGRVRWNQQLAEPFRAIRSVPTEVPSPIVPVIVGDRDKTITLANDLEAAGCFVAAIREPTVPAGTSRLRITLGNGHAIEDVCEFAKMLSRMM